MLCACEVIGNLLSKNSADAADAVPDHGSIAAFVELVHLDALLEVEARFLESSVTAIEHPKRLQHDHAPTDDHHLAVTRISQSAPRRKRARGFYLLDRKRNLRQAQAVAVP